VDPVVAERAALAARCDKELALAADLLLKLEQLPPPYSIQSVLKPHNRFEMLVSDLYVDVQLFQAVHPDREMRDLAAECKQRLVAFIARANLSEPLYRVLSAVDVSDANALTRRHLETTLEDFRRAGVNLEPAAQARISLLAEEIEVLKQSFRKTIREDTRYLELESMDDLDGLPEDYLATHQPDGDGVIRISTKYPDFGPLMTYARKDWVRERMSKLSANRAWPENQAILLALLEKRQEWARLLGYDTYAEYATADMMSGSGVVVEKFIDRLADMAEPAALQQYQRLLSKKRESQPGANIVNSWEKSYLSELVRRDEYQLDSALVRQYFGYGDTRDAMFLLTERLFGLQVRPWETKTWHPDVESYELMDGQQVIGRFFLDMHPRPDKHSHTTHFPLQVGVANRQLPMSALVTNFPGAGNPEARIEHSDVVSFTHEFGHLLRRMLSSHFEWVGLSSIERDFSEAPSQMLEEWVWDPGFLRSFARNIQGEPIPEDLVEAMNQSRAFGKALSVRSQLYLAAMSFNLHNYPPEDINLDELMIRMKNQYSMFDHVEGTHKWANFGHLSGYSALYYSYLWSEVIALDMFSVFEREGLFDNQVADRYRAHILAAGGSKPAAELVEDFLGRPFRMDAFIRRLAGDQPAR
jgi:thimet oligopeptidase